MLLIFFEKINFFFKIVLDARITSSSLSCMSENLPSNNIQNDDFYLNSEDSDYEKLFSRFKEIKKNIALLEKTLFK